MQIISKFYTQPAFFLLLFVFHTPLYSKQSTEQLVVSGTVILKEKGGLNHKALLSAFKADWNLRVDSVNTSEKTLVFSTNWGVTVMLAYLDYAAAPDEIGAAARLSWLWKTAGEECSNHLAQLVISVIGPANRSLDLHKIFTQTAAAVLENTVSPGIYMDDQYLLLSSGYYIAAARNMVQNQSIPLYCWVYFGRPGDGNAFTFGLSEFGLPEMEIVNSLHSESEVHATLYDAALSVVKYNSIIQDGQTLTTEEGSAAVVHLIKGTYLEDKQVLRLDY
jgi:hypothetical protein